ncbi:MAG: septum site-determining protein MinD, partial [Proteobacteria bacterium]|nr:septum site-determining protein MinD [Pseudomonadota bacterium]
IGIVPDHEDVIISANRGVPAVFDDESVVGDAFHRIAQRVLGEEIPIPTFEEEQGFWEGFKRWMGFSPAQEVI